MRGEISIQMDFREDVRRQFAEMLTDVGVQIEPTWPYDVLESVFFHTQRRLITQTPRRVHRSNALSNRRLAPHVAAGLRTAIAEIEAGALLRPRLSTRIFSQPKSPDLLLYDFGVHHLHLGTQPHPKDARFVSRTSELLFAYFLSSDCYLIDVLDHDMNDSFANRELAQILFDEWPEIVEHRRLPGVLAATEPLSNEGRRQLREAGVTPLLSLDDGSVAIGPGGGLTTAKTSLRVQQDIMQFREALRSVEAQGREKAESFAAELASNSGLPAADFRFRLHISSQFLASVIETASGHCVFETQMLGQPHSDPAL